MGSHSHTGAEPEPGSAELAHRRRAHRLLLLVLAPLWLGALLAGVLTAQWGSLDSVTSPAPAGGQVRTISGEVLEVNWTTSYADADRNDDAFFVGKDDERRAGEVLVSVDAADTHDGVSEVELSVQPATMDAGVSVGDAVRISAVTYDDGAVSYGFAGFDRSGLLLGLVSIFVLGLVAVAGWKGVRAVLGLSASIGLLWWYTLPALVSGAPALLVALVTGVLVLTGVLYSTHGISARTTTALLGTLAGTGLAAGLGLVALTLGNLTGIGSDDDLLLWASAPELSMSHLVLCAVVVTAIGVLNDVTITQSAAVWELARDSRIKAPALFRSALRIGRDHIASSVYTIVFVTAGASVSTYLLLVTYQRSFSQLLGTEAFSAEIITTLIGAISVIAAMPLTTALAVTAVRASVSPPASADPPVTPRSLAKSAGVSDHGGDPD